MEKHISLNNLKTLLEPIKALLDKKAALDDVKPIPPDWNAAEGEPGHVLNRTHWAKSAVFEILPETTIAIEGEGETPIITPYTVFPTIGNAYTVTFNGVDYECVCEVFSDGSGLEAAVFGNASLLGLPFETTDPFIIMLLTPEAVEAMGGIYGMMMPLDGSTSVTLSIKGEVEEVKKLDRKYYDASDWNAASEKEAGHVKNRPCGYFTVDHIPNTSGTLTAESGASFPSFEVPIVKYIVPGEVYEVTYCGETYTCVANERGHLGNIGYAMFGGEDTGEPFAVYNSGYNAETFLVFDVTGKTDGETVSVRVQGKEFRGLPTNYMSEIVEDAEDSAKYMDAYAGYGFLIDTEDTSYIYYDNPVLLEAVESIKKRGFAYVRLNFSPNFEEKVMRFEGGEDVPYALSGQYVVTLNHIAKDVNVQTGETSERYYCTCQVAVNFIAYVYFDVVNTLPTQVIFGGRAYIT